MDEKRKFRTMCFKFRTSQELTRRNSWRKMASHRWSGGGTIRGIWASSIQKVFLRWLVESWGGRTTRGPYTSLWMLRTQSFYIEQFTQQISSVSTEQSQAGVTSLAWSLIKKLPKTVNDNILKEVQPKEVNLKAPTRSSTELRDTGKRSPIKQSLWRGDIHP